MKSNVQQHICPGFLMDQRNWLWLTVTWNSKDQHQIPVWSLISGMLVSVYKCFNGLFLTLTFLMFSVKFYLEMWERNIMKKNFPLIVD